jgi:hypothetical protein
VDVVEARDAIVIDWCRPASGLDDEEDRVRADCDPVSASPIRQDDIASIGNRDSSEAEFEGVSGAIGIAVVENHARGERISRFVGDCGRSRNQQ